MIPIWFYIKKIVINNTTKLVSSNILKKITLTISWRFFFYIVEKRFQKYLEKQLSWISRINIFVSLIFIFISNKKLHTLTLIPINLLPVYYLLWNINYINNFNISEYFFSYILQAVLIISDSYISYKINYMFVNELEIANSNKSLSFASKSILEKISS